MPGSGKEYQYWGRYASTYDDRFVYVVGNTILREIKGWLISQFNDAEMVLELGCGARFFSQMIARSVKRLTATDWSEEMIEQARQKLTQFGNVQVQKEDCYNTSFEDRFFDAILLVNVLHIVKDPTAVLKESRRVVKDDGTVLVADVTGYGMSFLSKMRLGLRYLRKWGLPPSNNESFSPDRLADIAKEAGFVVEESILMGKDTKAVCLRGKRGRLRNGV